MRKWKDIFAWGFVSVLVLVWGYLYITGNKEYRQIKANAEYAKGVIYDHTKASKARNFIYFEFFVNNKRYKGTDVYRGKQRFFIGDTIVIVYDRTNPDLHMTSLEFWN